MSGCHDCGFATHCECERMSELMALRALHDACSKAGLLDGEGKLRTGIHSMMWDPDCPEQPIECAWELFERLAEGEWGVQYAQTAISTQDEWYAGFRPPPNEEDDCPDVKVLGPFSTREEAEAARAESASPKANEA